MVFLESLTANVFFLLRSVWKTCREEEQSIKDLFASQMLW